MNKKELIKLIKKAKKVYTTVRLSKDDDGFYVELKKSDLLLQTDHVMQLTETATDFVIDSDGFLWL